MRLLFDHNLSPRLAAALGDVYPGSSHVRDFGLDRASDAEIWEVARTRDYVIVSKDSDFHQRSLLFGSPPKVVWLRIGNCSVAESAAALRERHIPVRRFVEESTADFLVVS